MKEKKVSFRVRKIYYDQFANGTKHEELRALTAYWFKILRPHVNSRFYFHPEIIASDDNKEEWSIHRPQIAVIHSPKRPSLYFKIRYIYVDRPEYVLGRELSEQGKKDIKTELCIVTKLGERIIGDEQH